MIAIIDYGLGNIKAFANVYKKLGVPHQVARKTSDLEKATKVILPGVGAFDHAMIRLKESGMLESLNQLALEKQVPLLGICVGMQILARSSEEGSLPGLGWVDGDVRKFQSSPEVNLRVVPHMGWNNIVPLTENGLMRGLGVDARFYFLHSYYFHCQNTENVIAVTDYFGKFTCAVNSGNIYGVQFHPEKSHQWGIQLLKNFSDL